MKVDTNHPMAALIQISLNGVEQKMCVEADDEAGYVIRYIKEMRGYILTDVEGVALTEKVYGFVEIKVPQ